MPELYGPLDSLAARRAALEERRARLLAAARRATPMPEGQMVSGHYVAPSWTQYLPGLVDKFQQGADQRSIDEATLAQGVAEKAALRDSLAQLSGSASPPDELGGGPAKPAPTGADRRAVIASLMDNPAAGALGGEMLKDELITAPRAREAEAFKSELEGKRELARLVLADANATAAEKRQAAALEAQMKQLEARIAGQVQLKQMPSISVHVGSGSGKASASDKPAKPLPHAVHKELSALEDTAGTMSSLASSFKPEYSGPSGWAADKFGPYFPGASDETANWWKNYRKQAELVERHALFGAALTPGEQASWRSADVSPGMKGETIKKNLDTRKALADRLFANAVDRFEKGGHSNVRDVFNPEAVRSTGGASGDFSGPTVVRTGRRADGTRVEQLSDGTVRNAK